LSAGCTQETAGPAAVQSPEEFFNGKRMTFICPREPGGGYDVYSRLIAKYLQNRITGLTVIVQNIPEAGGLTGTNTTYAAAPDGLTISLDSVPGRAYAEVMGLEGVRYELAQFTWFCRVAPQPQVLFVSTTSGLVSIDDLRKLGRPVKMSTPGLGSKDYFNPVLLFAALDIPLKPITGYDGTKSSILATIRGEIDTFFGSWVGAINSVTAGDLKPILVVSHDVIPGLENVPNADDLITDPRHKETLEVIKNLANLDRCIIGPPGIPADRAEFLAATLKEIMENQAFLDEAKQLNLEIGWQEGQVAAEQAQVLMDVLTEMKPALQESLKLVE
jgi:tripartite-type tricarboxylate transporter receptor subunit TctC